MGAGDLFGRSIPKEAAPCGHLRELPSPRPLHPAEAAGFSRGVCAVCPIMRVTLNPTAPWRRGLRGGLAGGKGRN